MFCSNCGKEIKEGEKFCSNCGKNLDSSAAPSSSTAPQQYGNQINYSTSQTYDSGSIGWGFLGFFVPLAGLILFITWNNTKPYSAKNAGIGALIGVLWPIIAAIVIIIIVCCITAFA